MTVFYYLSILGYSKKKLILSFSVQILFLAIVKMRFYHLHYSASTGLCVLHLCLHFYLICCECLFISIVFCINAASAQTEYCTTFHFLFVSQSQAKHIFSESISSRVATLTTLTA